jgi:hypothetical protein
MDCDMSFQRRPGTLFLKDHEVTAIINQITSLEKVICFEVVEVNPLLDTKEIRWQKPLSTGNKWHAILPTTVQLLNPKNPIIRFIFFSIVVLSDTDFISNRKELKTAGKV